jgi:hypothetical protein
MVKTTCRTDMRGALEKLRRLRLETRAETSKALHQTARLAAVEFSFATQPRGHSDTARVKGETAVQFEVRRVYAVAADVFADIEAGGNKAAAKAFYSAFMRRQFARANAIKDKHSRSFKGVPIGSFNPQLHKAARRRGKVPRNQRPLQIVTGNNRLRSYIQNAKRRVGTLKAGWAVCARILGGTRGIPQFVTRNIGRSAGRVLDRSRDPNLPRISLANAVTYASERISRAEMAAALDLARRKFYDSLVIGMRAAARKAGRQ